MKGFWKDFGREFSKKPWMKNNTWNIRPLVDDSFVPSSKRPSVLYCKLTDFWPIVPFHSVLFLHKWVSWFCCELSLLFNVFYVIVPIPLSTYFSLVSNWPWFLELFLCLLHLFYLSFWNWYTVYKFRYGLLSIVVLEFYLPIVEEKFCLQINPTRNKIFFEVVYEFLYTFILCWTK